MSSKHDGRQRVLEEERVELTECIPFAAIEAQSKAIRDERRKEDDEARGTRFGQQILDTDIYEENARTGYVDYLPGNNDDEVRRRSFFSGFSTE